MPEHKPRIEDRTRVTMRAQLRGAGGTCEARILDISSRGLAASAEIMPARGDFVELAVGRRNLVGQVRWVGFQRFGIAFRDRISVIGLISGEDSPVALRQTQATRAATARRAGEAPGARGRIEFAVFFAAGAAATLYIAHFAYASLGGSLDQLEQALAPGAVSSSTRAQ